MNGFSIDFRRLRDESWWHWVATLGLFIAYFNGARSAMILIIALCALMAAYYYLRLRRLNPFPVQIRLGYLILLLAGLLPALHWVYWVQLVGTTLMVTMGYCPMARMLMLLPWNRKEPLSGRYVAHAFWFASCTGGLIVRTRESAVTGDGDPAPGCSLAVGN